jgi:hypothetical protein
MRIILALLFAAGFSLTVVQNTMAYGTPPGCPDCGYRRQITIPASGISANLSDFPVLVSIENDSNLKLAPTGKVQSSSGYDIAFTSSGGSALYHELELYDGDAGTVVAWVKVPTVSSSSDTVIYMYYGDSSISSPTAVPEGVWDDNYVAVWHMKSDLTDSTENNHDGSNGGTDNTTGKIVGARNFNGTGDYINLGTSSALQPSSLTYSFWVRATTGWSDSQKTLAWFKGANWDGNGGWYLDSYDPPCSGWGCSSGDDDRPLNLMVNGSNYHYVPSTEPNSFYPTNTWVYVAVTFNSSTNAGTAYRNGVSLTFSKSGSPDAISSTSDSKYMSARPGENNGLIGDLDEVRISKSVRSPSWIQAEYKNQNNPADFYTLGPQEPLAPPPGCPACMYFREITIPKESLCGDMYNFPVLVSIQGDNDLKQAAGKVKNSNGYDIVFTDNNGNALYHDLELYDGTAGTVVAWVKVPALSSSADTVIKIYYGDSSVTTPTAVPGGVWTAGYQGVWHMKESPGGSNDIGDSTSNANHGTSNLMSGNRTAGKIGYALDFNGVNNYITVPDSSSLDTPELTVEAWVNLANAANNQKIIGKTGLDKRSFVFGVTGNTPYPELWDSTAASDNSGWVGFNGYGTFSSNQWTHLALTWKTGGNVVAYRNGSQVHSTSAKSNNIGANDNDMIIGSAPWTPGDLPVDGMIDEIHVSTTVRDACWISTEYANQNNPGGFYNLGAEQQVGDHTITANTGADGLISPIGAVSVVDGADQTFTVTPDPGYQVKEVLTDSGTVTLTNGQYTFSNVSEDHIIYVTFELVPGDFDWSEGSFDYRKQISISADMLPDASCSSGLNNYPVLIKIDNDNDLKAHVLHSAGYDIVFKLGDGTPLYFEVENYDAASGSLTAWVRIPTLSNSTDTNIYMYYGNSSITSAQGNATWVWDFADYEGVWHFNESPNDGVAGGHADSTSNANHGTPMDFQDGGGGSTAVAGLMAGADRFVDNQNDRVVVADDTSLTLASNFTIETWVKFDTISTDQHLFYKQHSGSPWFSYYFYVLGDNRPNFIWKNSSAQLTELTLSTLVETGQWYYLVAVKDSGSLRLYLRGNGSEASDSTTVSGTTYDTDTTLNIGGSYSGGTGLDGIMDEVRIASVPRSVCWIDTSYNNMRYPGSYISVGSEEGDGATYTITASAGEGGSISPLGSVTVAEGADKTFTVTAAYGYEVDDVLVNGSSASLSGSQYTFTNVTSGPQTIAITFAQVEGDYGWDGSSSFLYRRPLVIDHTKLGASCGSDLTGFPVLVQVAGDAKLKSVSESGHVESQYGYDIVFKDSAGTLLNHEIEYYDKLTGALTAWVRVPSLSASQDQTIYMYYGNSQISTPTENPPQVWDTNFKGVWHLKETDIDGGSGDIKDSTTNDNDGTTSGMDTNDQVAGKIAGSFDLDGYNDYMSVPDDASLDITTEMTVEAWVKLANSADDQKIIGKRPLSGTGFLLAVDDRLYPEFWNSSGTRYTFKSGTIYSNQWTHLVVTWKKYGNLTGYVNGSQVNSIDAGYRDLGTNSANLIIGGAPWDPDALNVDGIVDEIRISNTLRSTCWIETGYSNQNDPSAFISLGAEEGQGVTYTITASAGTNGSISPVGAVTVSEGGSKTFSLVADEGYEVDTVAIGGAAAQSYEGAQYLFTNVTADTSIAVTFKVIVVEPPPEEETPPGCSKNVTFDYSSGFNVANLEVLNTEVDTDGYVTLNTGAQAIDPSNIVIPFRQEVAVYFMYELASYTENDFGWMLADVNDDGVVDGDDDPDSGTRHQVYGNINDNNNNGVLDYSTSNTANKYGDVNGDGVVNALDNRQVLGTFEAGTELAFYLKIDQGSYDPLLDDAVSGEDVYLYTKKEWNKDIYRGYCAPVHPISFERTYNIGLKYESSGPGCTTTSGWMDEDSLNRAKDPDIFDLQFDVADTSSLTIETGQLFSHVMVGAPADNPNAWVLGWEDYVGGLDTDHNDMVFIIERETGGTVQLKPEAAITPADADGNIHGVTIGVWDYMPCAGDTDITYYLSIDAGANWVEVSGWDEVYSFTLVGDGRKFLGDAVTNWSPGTPAYTYRTRRVDFTELGLSGDQLIWRADLKSQQEGCEPKVIDMSLDLTIGIAGELSRSTPTVLANVMYSGSMETPAADWTTAELRGHLKATRIYDATDPSQTSTLELWDAGDVLKNQMEPDNRTIYIPNSPVSKILVDSAEQLAVGDGVKTTFSGWLAHAPVLATTVQITDQRETFTDLHTDELNGSLGGSGWINRFTGKFRITFNRAPNANQPITATYSYITYTPGTMLEFTPANVSNADLGIDDTFVFGVGYLYEFDNTNTDDPPNEDDGDWLVHWVRGYKDGSSKSVEKEWVLGAIDHSTAAVLTPPSASPWYYGTAFPEDIIGSTIGATNDRKGYRAFRDAHINRRTVVFAGARDGMLHAFDAGEFRWADSDGDTAVDEGRGLFDWDDLSSVSPAPGWCADVNDCPDYGTGKELWAFIPANLLPRLKNNYMQAEDQAYVDASPALADVFVQGAGWRTVLLSAEGNGGDTIFCLDVTDPDNPEFMWEFADPELFRSRSSPSVAQIGRIYDNGDPKWVAFFVSGKTYDDTLYPSIYVIDIADGSVVEQVYLDAEPAGAGGILSGQPTIVDSDGNGYVDRLYIGIDKGRLYKVNVPDDPERVKYGISHCVINTDFTDKDVNEVPAQWHYQPIYGSPAVVSNNSVDLYGRMTYDILIFFGTGDNPYYDEDINFDDTRYFFYAYRDTAAKGSCDSSKVALDWFYQLPEGHRIYASAFAAAGNIYFGTSTGETEDPCDTGANSGNSFDPNAGKLFAFDLENAADGPLLEKVVGNVLTAPVVEDKHIYVQSVSGDVDSFGSGTYNSKTRKGGIPEINIHWWRELF